MTSQQESHASHAERAPGPWTVRLCLALLCLIWGSTYLVIRKGLEDLPPFTSAGMRFALAAALFAALAPRLSRREGGRAPPPLLSVVMGLANIAIPYGLVYWSETVLPSGLVSVLWAVFPLCMAFCGHVFIPGEHIRGPQWSGFVTGFLGVVLLFVTDVTSLGPEALVPALLLLLSPAVYALGTTYVKLHGKSVSSVLLNRNGMLLGALCFCLLAFLVERDQELRLTSNAIFSVLFLAVFGTVVTFGLFFWLMRYAAAYLLSLIAYVIPVIALTEGTLLAGEPFGPRTALGTALVLSGVAMVRLLRGKIPQPKPARSG